MKHKSLKTLSLAAFAVLASCGESGNVSGSVYLGDAFTKMNAIVLDYTLPKTLGADARISGRVYAQENAEIKSEYYLAYSSTSPFSGASSYSESVMLPITKSNLESESGEVKFDLALNLASVFPSKKEEGTVYFVIHSNDWKTTDVTRYGFTSFKYNWEGETVKLLLD